LLIRRTNSLSSNLLGNKFMSPCLPIEEASNFLGDLLESGGGGGEARAFVAPSNMSGVCSLDGKITPTVAE
jgi:hypothetical protein